MFGSLYDYARAHLDLFNVSGAKVVSDGWRRTKFGSMPCPIEVRLPGVIIRIRYSSENVRVRTPNGGWKQHPLGFSPRAGWRNIILAIMHEAEKLSRGYAAYHHIRSLRSLRDLPAPCQFIPWCTALGSVVENHSILQQAEVKEVVGIANNLKLVPPLKPDVKAWFYVEGSTIHRAKVALITDGEEYHGVRRDSKRVMEVWEYMLTDLDKELLRRAIEIYRNSIAE